MKTLLCLLWNEVELKGRIKPLEGLGCNIHPHWSTTEVENCGDQLPDLFIISLDRLPSHSKRYAE
jgi:hypothetical protein